MGQNIQDAGSGKQQVGTAALGATSDFAGAVFSPITELLKPIIAGDSQALASNPTFQQIANSPVGNIADTAQQATQSYQQWAQAHPEGAKNLESLLNIGSSVIGEEPVNVIGDEAAQGAKAAANAGQGVLDTVKTAGDNIGATKDLTNLQETISPKITSKETQAIINEGRLTRGND